MCAHRVWRVGAAPQHRPADRLIDHTHASHARVVTRPGTPRRLGGAAAARRIGGRQPQNTDTESQTEHRAVITEQAHEGQAGGGPRLLAILFYLSKLACKALQSSFAVRPRCACARPRRLDVGEREERAAYGEPTNWPQLPLAAADDGVHTNSPPPASVGHCAEVLGWSSAAHHHPTPTMHLLTQLQQL